ncbi:MAG: hypothetical protein ACOCV1_00020 [Bacillota bacterium]
MEDLLDKNEKLALRDVIECQILGKNMRLDLERIDFLIKLHDKLNP